MTPDHDLPVMRLDEIGRPYVPLYPGAGLRMAPLSVRDALTLWHVHAQNARQAVAQRDIPAWTAATMDANFYVGIAIELEPMLAGLRDFPLPDFEGAA